MARPRTPNAKAKAIGAAVKNPGRHRGRASPKSEKLGGPPARFAGGSFERKAFELLRKQAPWLKESHRVLVEVTAGYYALVLDPDAGASLQVQQELRRCLGQLGMTPADESKVSVADGEAEDPEEAFFH